MSTTRHVSIGNIRFNGSLGVPLFYSGNCPRLQHLELGPYVKHPYWTQVPLSVTSLSLSLRLVGGEVRPFFQHPSFQKLTMLFIDVSDQMLDLNPDSVHFPLLEKLEYHSHHLQSINGDIFNPRTPRFPKVTRLVFDSVLCFKTF